MALTKNFYSCCNLEGIIYSAKSGTDYTVGSVYIVSAGNCYYATSDGPATAEVDDTWSPIPSDGCENPECQPCPTPTPTPTVCDCLLVDSNLVTAATGNTEPSLNNIVNIEYYDCSGLIQVFEQTTLSQFYLCTQDGIVERVSFYQDNTLYEQQPLTSNWNPFPGININYTRYGDCFGDPCGIIPTSTPQPTTTLGPTSTQTPTPTTTPTPGPTSTQTPTPTTTPTATPTPTPTPTRITIISVNEQYATDFIDCCDVSGTTVPSDSYVPHPVWTNNDGDVSIIQLNAVALGGFNGLNN